MTAEAVTTIIIIVSIKVFKCQRAWHHAVTLQLLLQCAYLRLIVLQMTHNSALYSPQSGYCIQQSLQTKSVAKKHEKVHHLW